MPLTPCGPGLREIPAPTLRPRQEGLAGPRGGAAANIRFCRAADVTSQKGAVGVLVVSDGSVRPCSTPLLNGRESTWVTFVVCPRRSVRALLVSDEKVAGDKIALVERR